MGNPFRNWFWSSLTVRWFDLLAAAIISFVLPWYDGEECGEMEITAFVEPLVIFLILIVNAIVEVWQESNAEKALEALKEIQSEHASVIRNNERVPSFLAKELVLGDIVELKVGDKVPADMRVVELVSSTLRLEQGSLTGESEAVNKTNKPDAEDTDIQGKKCIVFAGTTIFNGLFFFLVTHTGMDTEIGKVQYTNCSLTLVMLPPGLNIATWKPFTWSDKRPPNGRTNMVLLL